MQSVANNFALLCLAVVLCANSPQSCYAGELAEGWAEIFEIATCNHYREPYYNYESRNSSAAKLPSISQTGRPKQREVAKTLLQRIREIRKIEKRKLDVAAAIEKQWNELQSRLTQVLPKTERLDSDAWRSFKQTLGPYGLYDSHDNKQNQLGVDIEWDFDDLIEQTLLPIRQRTCDVDFESPPIAALVTHDGANRQIWSSLTNVSSQKLTNVLIELRFRYRKGDIGKQYVFVREWNAGETVWPCKMHRINVLPPGLPEPTPDVDLGCRIESWSDQGHGLAKKAKTVGFFQLRDPLIRTMVHKGARYLHQSEDRLTLLTFTKVQLAGDHYEVEAKLREAKLSNEPRLKESNLRGRWKIQNFLEEDYADAVSIHVPMYDANAKPIRIESNVAQVSDKAFVPTVDFYWENDLYRMTWIDQPKMQKNPDSIQPLRRLPDTP